MTNGKSLVKTKILFVFFLFLCTVTFAQKSNTIKVYNVSGQAFINELMTPKQAKEMALNDAKSNALRKAGIGEYIRSNLTLLSSTVGDKYDEYINTEQQSQLEGSVLDFTIIKDTQYVNADKLLVVAVTIDATVMKHETKPDVNFDVRLFGVKIPPHPHSAQTPKNETDKKIKEQPKPNQTQRKLHQKKKEKKKLNNK